jgi:septal ring factor EnvC (AmiA/AmiB activator)
MSLCLSVSLSLSFALTHLCRTTQLEDPRLNKYGEQVAQLNAFLRIARVNMRQKESDVVEMEKRLKQLEHEIVHLTKRVEHAKATKASNTGALEAELRLLHREKEDQSRDIEAVRHEMQYDQEGLEILETVGTRLDERVSYGLEVCFCVFIPVLMLGVQFSSWHPYRPTYSLLGRAHNAGRA